MTGRGWGAVRDAPSRAPPRPPSSLLLESFGPGTLLWRHSDPSCRLSTPPKHTPFYSLKDYFLSTPDMPGTVNKGILGPASTQAPTLHLSKHSLYPTGFLLFSPCFNILHMMFPQFECFSLHYLLWVACVSGSAQLSREPFLTAGRGLHLDLTATMGRPLSICCPHPPTHPMCLCYHLAIQVPEASTRSPH